MSEGSSAPSTRLTGSDMPDLRGIWVLLVVLGIMLSIVGFVAIGSSFVATLATMLVFGIILVVGAILHVVTAVVGRSWRGFFLHVLMGILYLIAGVFMIERPVEAAVDLTLLIAASLLVGGILRIVMSVVERFPGWGWMLLNGVISLLLGAMIWRQWPLSGLWVIGLFVGIEMLFSGMSLVMLGMAVRTVVPKDSH
jgi:uncharacterized membrane protein HdeD (DUF308 family)